MLFSAIDTIVTDLTDASTTDFPTATRLIYANEAMADLSGTIIQADGKWQWDDTNYTDLPIGKATLVAGQQDYSFDDTFISIEGVSVLDSNGNYQKLKPFDKSEFNVDPDEYFETDGMPRFYDKQGRSVFLYPAPAAADVTTANGLKVFFKRKTKDITSFGATSPGFVPTQHMILAYMISIPYCMKYKKDRVALYEKEVRDRKEAIITHYSKRADDERHQITTKRINHR